MSARPSTPEDQTRFAEVLGEAIARRNLTLERISSALRQAGTPVSIATLSYWQTARSLPTRTRSLEAVKELERILRVPVGHLSKALPGDTFSRWDPIAEAAHADRGDLLLHEMGFSTTRPYTTQWVQDTVQVSAHNAEQREGTRQLLQSTTDGLERIPLVFHQSSVVDTPPTIEAVTGCELGRVVQLEDHAIMAAELLLPHPLALAEQVMLEYRVIWDTGRETDHGFARVHTGPVAFHVMDVTFDDRPAAVAEYFTGTRLHVPDDDELLRQPIAAGRHLQLALADPSPGVHGLSWTFAGDLDDGTR